MQKTVFNSVLMGPISDQTNEDWTKKLTQVTGFGINHMPIYLGNYCQYVLTGILWFIQLRNIINLVDYNPIVTSMHMRIYMRVS